MKRIYIAAAILIAVALTESCRKLQIASGGGAKVESGVSTGI